MGVIMMHRNSVKTDRLKSGLDSVKNGNTNKTATRNNRKRGLNPSALLPKKREHRTEIAKNARQTIFLNCYADTMDISKGLEAVGVTRRTFYNWMKDDNFKENFEDVTEGFKDWIESHLLQKVAKGDTAATIFVSKCRLRDRGYGPDNWIAKTEINNNLNLYLGKEHINSIVEAGSIEPETMKDSPGKQRLLDIIAKNQQAS